QSGGFPFNVQLSTDFIPIVDDSAGAWTQEKTPQREDSFELSCSLPPRLFQTQNCRASAREWLGPPTHESEIRMIGPNSWTRFTAAAIAAVTLVVIPVSLQAQAVTQ